MIANRADSMAQKSPFTDRLEGELEQKLRTEQRKLAVVQEIGRALSSALDLDRLLGLIMEKVTELMRADRSTLYLLTEDGEQLWSKVLQGGELREIRLTVGEGIAGWVAASGDIVNIPDAYTDDRFQPRVDLETGYRTRSILCVPMRDTTGRIVGVLQLLNKEDGPFTGEDEELLTALASQAAVSIENSKLYHSVVAKNVELLEAQEKLQQKTDDLNILYEIERDLSTSGSLDEFLERLLRRTMTTLGAQAGSIALIAEDGQALRFSTVLGPAAPHLMHKVIPLGSGVIGWVAAERQPLIVNDPAADPRHDASFAAAMGWVPRHLACAPLPDHDAVLGAIELVDKDPVLESEEGGFTANDLQMLTLIAGQASRAIQVARSKAEREKESRLATIGQMLAGVLHDLKTPMTIISGYAQLMAQIEDAARRETYVDEILRQFDLMSGMTREVLAFARGESSVLIRKVYLHKFLETVQTQLEHSLANRAVDFRVDARYAGVAYFDENSMLRLVHNLARNAADAMEDGGSCTITTRADEENLYFDFADTGPGIPAALHGRLFELFASGKKHGTGLGLALVKNIVEQHDGEITYESTPGVGTSFQVRIPLERPAGVSDKTGPVPKFEP